MKLSLIAAPFSFLACLLILVALAVPLPGNVRSAHAQDASNPSGQPVPRFATIGRSQVRMRQGPSREHRILWEFRGQEGLPVEVVAETESWRQIRDPEGDLGWVHRALLNESRSVIIVGGLRPLRRRPANDSRIAAYIEPRVVARLHECSETWCEISIDNFRGWVRHEDVWGVYPREVVN